MSSWKETRRALRRPFESGGYILLKWIIPTLPRSLVTGFAQCLGALAMALPLREKRVGMINLDAVYGDAKPNREKRAILRGSFATFAQTMLDVFWFSRNPEKRLRNYVEFADTPHKDILFEDRPAICITAHMGSWETMGQFIALHGIDMASIAATVKNKTVDRLLIEQRERTGQTIIPQKGALKSLIARLRKNGKTAFVLDQSTHPDNGGIRTDVLGMPMHVSPAPATLAYRTGAVIIMGFCLPQPDGRYVVHISETILPPPFDKNQDMDAVAAELTQRVEDLISEKILEHPAHWLWAYKHWRREDGEVYPDKYPIY